MGHIPDFGFVSCIDAVGSVVPGAHHGCLFDEAVDERSSVPVGGVRTAVFDDLVGSSVEGFSAPFAVEEIEVESALVRQCERVPSLNQRGFETEFAVRIDELHER